MNAPAKPLKHAFVHKRAEHFLFPCRKLIIIGLDTEHVMGSHPLWRADCQDAPPQERVDSIRRHGILQPGKARKIKDDHERAEVVMGRDRVKALRMLEDETGQEQLMPMLVWPAGTPIAEIIGAVNAENFQRKNETLVQQIEHVWMQLVAEGYTNGAEDAAIKSTAISTGFSPQRIRYMVTLRGDANLHKAVKDGTLRGEAGMSLASIDDEEARAAEFAKALENPDMTTSEVRERAGYAKAAAKAKRAPTAASTSSAPSKGNKPGKAKKDDEEGKGQFPGIGKPLARRLIESQMSLSPDERDLDQLVIKALKAAAGVSAISTVPGLVKAMKRLGVATTED